MLGVFELTTLRRDHRQVPQCVDPIAPITRLFGVLHGQPESGFGLVMLPEKYSAAP